MAKTRGFIFDFNGVLFWDTHLNDQAWRQYSKQLRDSEISDEEMVHKIHGRTNKHTITYLTGSDMDDRELAEHIENKENIYRQLCLDNHQEFTLAPGAVELLDYLKQRALPFTIATSSEIGNLRFYYKHLKLAKWFDIDIVVYDDGTMPSKPAPDIYIRAARKLQLEPTDCVVIEDSRSGILSAHNAGIGKIIAIGPHEKQAELATLPGVDETIIDFYKLLEELQE